MKRISGLIIFFCCSMLPFQAVFAEGCDIDGPGSVDISCAPGNIRKNGDGNAIVAVDAGQYMLVKEGRGNLCLTGLDDFSGVSVAKDGDGNIIWVPADPAKGKGPKIKSNNGNGSIRRGVGSDLGQCQ